MIYILPKSQKNQGQRVPLMPAILLYFFLFSVSWITSGNPLHDWTILLVFHKVSHLQPFLASLSSLVVCFHPANVPKYTTFYLIILLLTLANSLLYHLISNAKIYVESVTFTDVSDMHSLTKNHRMATNHWQRHVSALLQVV